MTHRSINAAAISPARGRGDDGERHRIRAGNRIPADVYIVGDHNLGHGGAYTQYKQPGLAPYQDTWYEPGVDDYFRAQHAKKMEKYKDRIVPPSGHDSGHICIWPNFIMDSWRWRFWHPHEVGVVERWSLFGVDREAPKFVKDAPPSAPGEPTTSSTESSITLGWGASHDDVGVKAYEVFLGTEATPRITTEATTATRRP